MTEIKFEEFCKELKLGDMFKAYYEPTNRELILIAEDLSIDYYYIKVKCLMDNDGGRHSVLGNIFTINLLSQERWELTKL